MQLSIVLPVYNEEGIIQELETDYKRNREFLSSINGVEFIFVDDGSLDDTYKRLSTLDIPDKRIIRTEHRGLSHALYTGILAANGDLIVTMDADGQFSFEDIPHLVNTLVKNDADIVAGYRIKRNDSQIRKITSKISNTVKRLILKDNILDSACTLKCFKKEVRDKILYPFDGFHRFISSLAAINGLKLVQIPIPHRERRGGEAKFGILNRLPDVIFDICGVWWLKYKRFSTDADIRRFSFYPDTIFVFLFVYVFLSIFSNYFKVVDDFWLYGSLNRFIGYDYSKSYGWENFIFDEIVPPLIRGIYAVLLNTGRLLNVQYPLEWAGKVVGIAVLLSSYILFSKYFSFYIKRHLAKWLSLSIIFSGLMSSEIYSGIARSFTYVIIPILLISLEKDSTLMQSVLIFFTALTYPVIIPLLLITIFVFYITISPQRIYRVILPAISAVIGLLPMLTKIDITGFSSPVEGDPFLRRTQAFELPQSSDLYLLFGFFNGRSLVEWLNFNLFHQWILNEHLINVITLYLILMIILSIMRRISFKHLLLLDVITFLIQGIFLLISLSEREYVEKLYIFRWMLFGLSVYWVGGVCSLKEIRKYPIISAFTISSIIAFVIIHILSRQLGFGVHEPGRQLQRAFAIIIPILSSVTIYNLINTTKRRGIIYFLLILIALIFYPQLKLVSPNDKYIIQRIAALPSGSILLSHPLTANWVVSHTNKYSTIIDEQIRVTKKNPIRGSTETVMPTEMAYKILSIYYSKDNQLAKSWCKENPEGYILIEDFYYSDAFFQTRREPYFSFVERHNKERNFALLNTDLKLRHYITPESFLIVCSELTGD